MRVIRFLDKQGLIRLGREVGGGTALWIERRHDSRGDWGWADDDGPASNSPRRLPGLPRGAVCQLRRAPRPFAPRAGAVGGQGQAWPRRVVMSRVLCQ